MSPRKVQFVGGGCPTSEKHTDRDLYLFGASWEEWVRKMSKTHKPTKCPGCDLLLVWVPKRDASP